MSLGTAIEWTDATWNPIRGCTKISPGCKHCYAETFAERFRGVKGHPYEQGFDLRLVPEKLLDPFFWTSPSMVFVNSMSDLFHEGVPDEFIISVARVMVATTWHTYKVLTKRSQRMRKMLNGKLRFATSTPHIWWGVSVEDVRYGKPRIAHLRDTPAQVKFLSVEPLLEDLGDLNLSEIDWVIAGGESGPGARPLKKAWLENVFVQCQTARVPFFFKQWGGVRKKAAGRKLHGRTYDEFPFTAKEPIPNRDRRQMLAANVQLCF